MKRDDKFIDVYSLVIGTLAIVALAIFLFATKMSDVTQEEYTAGSPEYQAALADRIRPFGQVYMPGEEVASGEPQVAEAPRPEPVETVMSGPQVYNDACLVCHGSGVGGAPMISDSATWEARIAQGNDTLYLHAIEGFTGQTGYMPPKGARMDLSDADVRAAVDYMIGEISE